VAFARFGTGGATNDNIGTGGMGVGIDQEGRLLDFALTERLEKLSSHPDTGYDFTTCIKVPAFNEAVEVCVEAHRNVLHHNLVSWDMAVDQNAMPIFIEYNFRGALWLYQLVSKSPLLRDLTDDVLHQLSKGAR
jgi:hypothetical protein